MKNLLLILILFLFSCSEDSNPVANEYRIGDNSMDETPVPCCVTPTDVNLMMAGEQEDNDLPWPMIVGGEEVDPACPDCKYPFMVSLQYNGGWFGGHFCGGALVRPDWVVTAAHCVQGESAGDIKVEIGLHDVDGTIGSETRYVDQIIEHPAYNNFMLSYDYALLHLSSPSSFEPIQLVTDESHSQEPVMSTTMGWGAIYSGGPSSDILLEVDVPIDDSCGYILDAEEDPSMICAGDSNGGEDSCQGDSGGPLIMTNDDGEHELIGIVSWGYGCADAGYPGVYSNVWYVRDWFFGYIGEPEEDDFEVELYGDVNFDGYLDITDIILVVGFILGDTPTEEQFLTADMNQDGILNILDIIDVVGQILGTTFGQSIDWLRENFPELEVDRRLMELNKSIHFIK